MSRAFPEGSDAGGGQLSDGKQTVYAALARVMADLLVEFHPALAHLGHVAEQEDLRAAFHGKHVDRGAHRVRIGVVAVVDEVRPGGSGPPLPASAGRPAACTPAPHR